ncbi:Crp/Fnr family transcriptional regulator [Dyadobacter sp. LHD-138]|uniref:Crp/Fnr family transcriptional regulator n=1 Tax=Dyadobacter sp. LHD-138 TaxID=3071413 RepID=UPI0027E16521|nr:Crp/Fnr family transcriptional regulator [Dyadobacter sp. LHD-138]MDQ6480175.1 Crp/Fnr family transcriptional regulator [Dyadobacter sp. LHD-138]
MNAYNDRELFKSMQIQEREYAELLEISKVRNITNGSFYVAEGQIPTKFAFLLSGLFRYVYIDSKGNEFTKSIITEHNLLVSYSSMLYQKPSHFFIQAIEDAEILEVNYQSWLELQKTNTRWDKFLIAALEKGYCLKEKRERDLLMLDAETRYKNFLTEFPGLESRITQQMIASYLGIKPESLSRIRKKLQG